MTVVHEALCNWCSKREVAIPPNALFSNYRPPENWLQLRSLDFCSNKCLKEYVNGLQD